MSDQVCWWVIVPMKDTRLAKSRLGGVPGERRQLAIAMAQDTLRAVVGAACVEGALVVCDGEPDVEAFSAPGVSVVARPGLSLNEAVLAGAELLRAEDASRNLAVVPGDLPYLRSAELDAALGRAAGFASTCTGDRTGRGTTLTTARAGTDLVPSYGIESLALHRGRGAAHLSSPAWSGLRRDVDHREDLAVTDGLGPRTRHALSEQLVLHAAGGA
jgi:2-phospho-L-lactate guanylyltransferase